MRCTFEKQTERMRVWQMVALTDAAGDDKALKQMV